MIDVKSLSYTYADGTRALSDLSFHVDEGESVGLIGPNGAGKTTLFLCLCGVVPVKTSSIMIAGLDPSDATQRKRLPSSVGIVFQNSDDQLFSSTVFDDVAFGPLNLELPPDAVRQRVAEALGRVGMTGHEQRVPFHLSGGEKRRTALAGVLAMRPSVLLLDEPTMFLDPRSRRSFIQLIRDLHVIKLIASHDMSMVRETCSRVLLLDEGKLIADGAPAQIMDDAALMERHGLASG